MVKPTYISGWTLIKLGAYVLAMAIVAPNKRVKITMPGVSDEQMDENVSRMIRAVELGR